MPTLPTSFPEFPAIFNAHGLYNSEQFVLRLSLKNHQLVDEATDPDFDRSKMTAEHIKAYSTYLHETIHWWQHVGSTSGFILSMCYPAQTHINHSLLAELCKLSNPKKSIKTSALMGELAGTTHTNQAQGLANSIVNNSLDIDAFKTWILRPDLSAELYQGAYFESQGHCFNIAYGSVLSLLNGTFDSALGRFVQGDSWDKAFRELSARKVEGYYYGSPMTRSRIGVVDLFEGQACFNQLVFLARSGMFDPSIEEFRRQGFLHGVYERAFLRFLELTGLSCPNFVDDPIVSLFLLVCDVAINPVEGFPCAITDFSKLIYNADPGIRFERMCIEIAEIGPSISARVKVCSKQEYMEVSSYLAERCCFASAAAGQRQIEDWITNIPGLSALMTEHRDFSFSDTNVVIRVLLSHFISMSFDKRDNPEFFCWPGYWKAGSELNDQVEGLWLRHLSLFSDKADSDAVFTRIIPGKDPKLLLNTQDRFFANVVVYDLTRQWILVDGPFKIDFGWLSDNFEAETWSVSINEMFRKLYGKGLSDIDRYSSDSS